MEEDIWSEVSADISSAMKPFNDYLVSDSGYRKDSIAGIADYLDRTLEQTAVFFNSKHDQLKFDGHSVLSPEERLEHIFDSTIRKGYVSIRRTETSTVRFDVQHQDQIYHIYIEVPYLINGRVIYNDTQYFPLLPIVERGGVNVTNDNSVIIKVMRMPIRVGRKPANKVRAVALSGRTYWDLLVTVKVHQGAKTALSENIPLVIYHLSKLGFDGTMNLYGFKKGSITVTDVGDPNDPTFDYIMLPNGLYIKADIEQMKNNVFFRRMVISLYKIFLTHTQFALSEVIGNETDYYCATLGKYTSSNSREVPMNKLMLHNAQKHLETTDLMLDPVAIVKLASVGIKVKDIYDLLFYMYHNIDRMLVDYRPEDLCNKAIGSLDQLMADVVRKIARHQYKILNSKKGDCLTPDVVNSFCKKASHHASWIGTTPVFRPAPAVYNSNQLISISGKQFQTLDSMESQYARNRQTRGKAKSGKKKKSSQQMKADPSQWCVTAPLDLPSSAPVETGSINPYLQIKTTGDIIRPDYADEITHIYD